MRILIRLKIRKYVNKTNINGNSFFAARMYQFSLMKHTTQDLFKISVLFLNNLYSLSLPAVPVPVPDTGSFFWYRIQI